MRRVLATWGLLLLIIVIFSFIIFRALAASPGDNFFNHSLRAQFSRSGLLRNVLALHSSGDSRFDYTNHRFPKLWIEVDSMAGLSIPEESLDLLAERIKAVSGEDVIFVHSDNDLPFASGVNVDQVKALADQYKNFRPAGEAYLYLLYLNSSSDDPTLLGSTYQDFGIVLYDQTLRQLTANNPGTFDNYVESTILHEFGHQLGLQHNENPGCVMNPDADTFTVNSQSATDVVTDFCGYEKGLVSQIH